MCIRLSQLFYHVTFSFFLFFFFLLTMAVGRKKRKRWTYAENVKVMECFYRSRLPRNRVYRQSMLDLWIEEGMFDLSKERLAGQAQSILQRKLLSEDVLKGIRDRVGFQEEEERQGHQDHCVIC